MVDATTLSLAATIAQTIVITITLLVFIFQFRSQEKAIHESSYQNLMGRYNDLVMMQAQKEKPNQLYVNRLSRLSGREQEISVEEAEAFAQLLVVYGILEEAFILYKKKWIDKETWDQWAAWLSVMSEDPHFMMIHDSSRGMFDAGFEAFLERQVEEKKTKSSRPKSDT